MNEPDRIRSYFKSEIAVLSVVTASGLIYNVGLLAGPYFQGKLIDAVSDIIRASPRTTFKSILVLALVYIAVILFVQGSRAIKRFAVRRFANDINASMQNIIYAHIVCKSEDSLLNSSVGSLMTKAVSDVDACVEGMRKFTTEVFDTGVFIVSYLVVLFIYNWKLTAVSCVFIPTALFFAGRLRKVITGYTSSWRKSMSDVAGSSYELVNNAMLYRIYGREEDNCLSYEKLNKDYEKKAVLANIWENSMMPIYKCISLAGVVFIIVFGSKRVVSGSWTIGTFTAYVTMFAALAEKASHAGKLFNAVQKAEVSWLRIKPFLKDDDASSDTKTVTAQSYANSLSVCAKNVSFSWTKKSPLLSSVSFDINAGEIMGVTGSVACGKSTLARLFLGGVPYSGSITLNGNELSSLSDDERIALVAYMGHDASLMSATLYDNVTLGDDGDIRPVLSAVSFDQDLASMSDGISTFVGNGGVRLSGGQQERIALARTLYHKKPLIVLDDPFASVDKKTEEQIVRNIKTYCADSAVLIISHRLAQFGSFDRVLLLNGDGTSVCAAHESLLKTSSLYKELYTLQDTGGTDK
jgi:ATP-binding cassette subfamily B protein